MKNKLQKSNCTKQFYLHLQVFFETFPMIVSECLQPSQLVGNLFFACVLLRENPVVHQILGLVQIEIVFK